MSCQLSLSQLAQILNRSEPSQSQPVSGIVTDSRFLQPGEVFVALEGERFDGHDFVATALEKGAIAVIVNDQKDLALPPNIFQLRVQDTLEAYQKIARWWRDQHPLPIIGITGSVGKTTTKELIAGVLSTQGKVLKTQKNYNNEIGVPKTLLGLDSSHDYGVVEMAMRGRGEIAQLTQIARPTIGVITNVGTAHIGRLGSEEAIAQAKCELLAEMPRESLAILNQDNTRLIQTAATVWQGETLTYGLEGGDIQGELLDLHSLKVDGYCFPLPLPGRHNALNYLAALAVAKGLGIDWQPFTEGITVELPGGRAQRYQVSQDIVILDETYNAGMESMIAALHLLKETPGQRHLAILGTMKELGEQSPRLHQKVGEVAKNLDLDHLLILVDDPEAEGIAQGAKGIPTTCFSTREEILQYLQKTVQEGDRLLFKASNSVGLKTVVEQFRDLY